MFLKVSSTTEIIFTSLLTLLLWSIPVYAQTDKETCLSCHDDPDLTGINRAGEEVSMSVSAAEFQGSAHADLECIDCHQDLAGVEDFPHEEELSLVDCGGCHPDEAETYQMHGNIKVGTDQDIPTCADCHGTHNIIPPGREDSPVSEKNLPKTCAVCHEDIDLTTKHEILFGEAVTVYKSSVHGRAVEEGIEQAALCNDCHFTQGSAHRIYGPANPQSTINHFNIPKTCGKCHTEIAKEYWEGIHGKMVSAGETVAPVCTHCHGEHGIVSPSDPRARVSPTRVAEATCLPCHESAYLNERYGIPTDRVWNWYDSYHGFKSQAGDITVANCTSCHGAHLILPHTNPKSSIYADNLPKTCGNCHPGITPAMATVPIHKPPGVSRTPAASIVRNIYIVAIILIIGAMASHWLIDLRKQIRLVRMKEQVRRMAVNEVLQHWLLMISFVVLVITGFSLRHSQAWWVDLLFGWKGGFQMRGLIHRVAAVVLTVTAIWHVLYLATHRGKKFLKDMWPSTKDFKQFFQMIAFNLGLRERRPTFGRFSYIEKAEYWALVWGTVVMVITGFFLWFDNIAVQWFPKEVLDVMLVIHYYEAWLAFLAILIWHLYSTVFSPNVYPMNPSWIDGKMPLEMYKHEHADDPELKKMEEKPTLPGQKQPLV